MSVAVFAAMSFPTFFLCLLLIKWFAVDLHWLPVGGMTNTGSDERGWGYILQVAAHLVLPVLALVMLQAGSLTRYFRASMLDVVRMDFIRTARAKGLRERTVIFKHARAMRCCPLSPCSASSYRGCSPAPSSPKRSLTGLGPGIFISIRWPPAIIRY